jgi:hypothetical protein
MPSSPGWLSESERQELTQRGWKLDRPAPQPDDLDRDLFVPMAGELDDLLVDIESNR